MSERVVRPSWLSDVSVIVSHEFISGQTQHLRPGKGKKKKKRNRKKWSEFPGGLMGDNGGLIVMWSRTDLMWENGKAEGRDSICWEKQTCIAAFRSFFLSFFLFLCYFSQIWRSAVFFHISSSSTFICSLLFQAFLIHSCCFTPLHPSSLFPILPHPSRFFLFSLFFCFFLSHCFVLSCFLVRLPPNN